MKRAGRVVALALEAMREGISTAELDQIAAGVLREHGARSAPTGGPSSVRIAA